VTTNLTRLTDSRLAGLGPGDHTDPATTGLQLRVRRGALRLSRVWLVRYKWQGQTVRLVIGRYPGTTLASARATAQRVREFIDDGIDPRRAMPRQRPPAGPRATTNAPGTDAQHSIENLAREFVQRYARIELKRPDHVESILNKHVLPDWKRRDVRTIKPREVIDLLDKIVERGHDVMANRTASVLGQMFKYGIHRGLVEDSPVKLLYRPGGKEKPRNRALTDDELAAYLKDPTACTRYERLAHVVTLLLLTGQRRGELALARWRDIDTNRALWTIPAENRKNGQAHVVPLSAWALAEFESLKEAAGESPFVLPDDHGKAANPKLLTRGVARCLPRFKKRGIAAFTLHDLRRTCRTGLGQLRVAPDIAERVIGHAQERLIATYDVGAYADEKRDALNKWAAHLESLRRRPDAKVSAAGTRKKARKRPKL